MLLTSIFLSCAVVADEGVVIALCSSFSLQLLLLPRHTLCSLLTSIFLSCVVIADESVVIALCSSFISQLLLLGPTAAIWAPFVALHIPDGVTSLPGTREATIQRLLQVRLLSQSVVICHMLCVSHVTFIMIERCYWLLGL
jgi:hypothetical protein